MVTSMITLQEKTRILNAMLGKMEAWAHAAHAPILSWQDEFPLLQSGITVTGQKQRSGGVWLDPLHSSNEWFLEVLIGRVSLIAGAQAEWR